MTCKHTDPVPLRPRQDAMFPQYSQWCPGCGAVRTHQRDGATKWMLPTTPGPRILDHTHALVPSDEPPVGVCEDAIWVCPRCDRTYDGEGGCPCY